MNWGARYALPLSSLASSLLFSSLPLLGARRPKRLEGALGVPRRAVAKRRLPNLGGPWSVRMGGPQKRSTPCSRLLRDEAAATWGAASVWRPSHVEKCRAGSNPPPGGSVRPVSPRQREAARRSRKWATGPPVREAVPPTVACAKVPIWRGMLNARGAANRATYRRARLVPKWANKKKNIIIIKKKTGESFVLTFEAWVMDGGSGGPVIVRSRFIRPCLPGKKKKTIASSLRRRPCRSQASGAGRPCAAEPAPRAAGPVQPAEQPGLPGAGREKKRMDEDGQMTMLVDDDDPPETAAALLEARRQTQATRGYADRAAALESDTDPDSDAEPLGAGARGMGSPMLVGSHEKLRPVCDGAGLCSLGAWPPWRRPVISSPQLLQARGHIMTYIINLQSHLGMTAEHLFELLASGQIQEDPLAKDPTGFRLLVDQVQQALRNDVYSPFARTNDLPQPVRIRTLQSILWLGGDPDYRALDHFGRGVRIGVGVKMPRTPAVYHRKRRWRLQGQGDPDFDLQGERAALGDAWRDNYASAKLHDRAILAQLEDAVDRGMALRLSVEEASFYFPRLTVNSLAGIAKVSEEGDVASVRLVLDGTHGVVVNRAIRQRDQDRCPVAADVRRVQREQHGTRGALGLALDVREAHRLPRVHPSDWEHQGCRSSLTSDLFVFVVGCFGVSSAAYWWSRLGGSLVRAIHLLALPTDELWLLLLADDLKAESTSSTPQVSILFVVLVLAVLGVPLSWHKAQGGRVINWIGYEVHLAELSLGITQRRAEWCVRFLLQLSRDGRADLGHLRSGLGRLAFVVGALEWERPFLAPYYAFLSRQPRWGSRSLPLYVRLVSHYLASRLTLRRRYPSAITRRSGTEPFRIDASAEGSYIGVGGWLPVRNSAGQLDKSLSPWFSFVLDSSSAPWAYYKGLPYKTIASLEAVGVLVALVAFQHHLRQDTDQFYCMPGLTDNRGNQYTVTRLQSTRFPLCAVLMEIAARSEQLRLRLSLDWIPRECNAEADRLASGDTTGFSPSLRQHVSWKGMNWLVLDWAMELGVSFFTEQAGRKELPPPSPPRDKRKRIPLRESDPWYRTSINLSSSLILSLSLFSPSKKKRRDVARERLRWTYTGGRGRRCGP